MDELEVASNMIDSIYIESKLFSSKKVLDLTDPRNLKILGITRDDLVGRNYIFTQILGHLAKMNQYDALIIPGAKEYIHGTKQFLEYYSNLIILRGF